MAFTDNVVDKVGTRLFEVSKRFKDYAPQTELNRATYNKLDEGKLIYLAEKYGQGEVEGWLERMKR